MKLSGIDFGSYPAAFPKLPIELILYFSSKNLQATPMTQRPLTVRGFCGYFQEKYKVEEVPAPRHLSTICHRLVSAGHMSKMQSAGADDFMSSYFSLLAHIDTVSENDLLDRTNKELSFQVYGFPFIYEFFRDYVFPIEHTSPEGDRFLGTAFFYNGGILTAKHCITGAHKLSIQGVSRHDLQSSKFYCHRNSMIDVVFIELPEFRNSESILSDNANVLEEVMTLGYPCVPGYHNFLAVEKAMVSARYMATTGSISASAEDIWMRERLLLITARIQGGNSGGPVVNQRGRVVGVSVNTPASLPGGRYDDMGYGTVIPMKVIDDEILDGCAVPLDVSSIEFVDFAC